MQNVSALENTQQVPVQGNGQNAGGQSPQGQVEPQGSRPEDTSVADRRPSGADPDQARRRWESKQSQRMEAIENSVSQLVSVLSKTYQPQAPSAGQGLELDNDPYAQAIESRVSAGFKPHVDAAVSRAVLQVETRMARDLIKSEAGNDPQTVEEIESVGVANGYAHIARQDPLLAAEQSVEAWKRWKAGQRAAQTQPNHQAPSRAQALGVNGSAPLANGSSKWTPEKIAEARANGTYSQNRNEILASVKSRLLG